jgi:hypothetical protein
MDLTFCKILVVLEVASGEMVGKGGKGYFPGVCLVSNTEGRKKKEVFAYNSIFYKKSHKICNTNK